MNAPRHGHDVLTAGSRCGAALMDPSGVIHAVRCGCFWFFVCVCVRACLCVGFEWIVPTIQHHHRTPPQIQPISNTHHRHKKMSMFNEDFGDGTAGGEHHLGPRARGTKRETRGVAKPFTGTYNNPCLVPSIFIYLFSRLIIHVNRSQSEQAPLGKTAGRTRRWEPALVAR